MERLFDIMLVLHIAGGTMSLLAAPVALATKKGSISHRRSGSMFFYGMTAVFITAVYMSLAHSNPFLFMVAFFSYQMVLSGERALHHKKLKKGQPVQKLDWMIVFVAFVVNMLMMVWGVYRLTKYGDTIGIVALFFGSTGMSFAFRDFKDFRYGNTSKAAWLFKHLGGMIGGYIAAVTAFLVVNFYDSLPALVAWLGPTVLGTPLILYFTYLYQKRLRKSNKVTEVVQVSNGWDLSD